MTAWPIRWWTAAERALVIAHLRNSLHRWCDDWGVASSDLQISVQDPLDDGLADAGLLGATAGGIAESSWISPRERMIPALSTLMFNARPVVSALRAPHTLAGEMILLACDALETELRAALTLPVDGPVEPSAGPGTGARRGMMLFSIGAVDAHIVLGLEANLVMSLLQRFADAGQHRPPSLASLHPLMDVVAPRKVTLRTMLDGATLDLATLCTLETGDVLTLEHVLDKPAMLVGSGGHEIAQVALVKRTDRKAVQWLPETAGQ